MRARYWRMVLGLPLLLAMAADAHAAVYERGGRIIPPVFAKSQIIKSPAQNIRIEKIRVEEVFRRRPAPEFISFPSVRQELARPRVPLIQPSQSFNQPGIYRRSNYHYGGGYLYNTQYATSRTDYQPTLEDYRHWGR